MSAAGSNRQRMKVHQAVLEGSQSFIARYRLLTATTRVELWGIGGPAIRDPGLESRRPLRVDIEHAKHAVTVERDHKLI